MLTPIRLSDYRPSAYYISHVDLHIMLWDDHTIVESSLKVMRSPQAASDEPLILNGEDLELLDIQINGQAVPANFNLTHLSLSTLSLTNLPDQFELRTTVKIHPELNKSLSGLYKSRHNFCTQCEAEGFRRITYFLDRPDVMSRFTTTISADKQKYPYLLSNGNCVSTGDYADGRHWVRFEDPSLKPCYLFALVAGDFDLLEDTFVTQSKRQIALQLYLEKGFADQGQFALDALKKAMRWDEETYGREYDLDVYMIVAVSDFNMGAMENKGLNIFNTRYILAKPETATDQDYVAIEGVIGHEYFHNWTGNRITCRDWFQLTLKEGLTVFRDECFTEDMTSRGVARLDNVRVLLSAQFPEDAGPNAHPIRPETYSQINNFYTHTVYRKGAEVIRMIRTLISASAFRKGMDLYFERHDGQAVTTEEFVKAMEDASGVDLTQFRRWYNQAGTPELQLTEHYDAEQGVLRLEIAQHTPMTADHSPKEPFHIPFAIALLDAKSGTYLSAALKGEHRETDDGYILMLKDAKQSFEFSGLSAKPVLSLLRDFSAPVKLYYDCSLTDRKIIFTHDTDAYCRFAAGQAWMVNEIRRVLAQLASQQTPSVDAELVTAYREILTQSDPQLIARLLVLPSMGVLIQEIKTPDLELLYQAKYFIETELARALLTEWEKIYFKRPSGAYQFNQADVGARALAELALFYLVRAGHPRVFTYLTEQYHTSTNMTDTLAALQAINDQHDPLRDALLANFYETWQAQPLVVNKWLALQASSARDDTFARVKSLLNHPAFHRDNPNNVYALLGGFGNNLLRFHEESGAAYYFMVDQIKLIDVQNPQVAARLMQPLLRFGDFDSARAARMQAAIAELAKVETLSSDLRELVEKALNK
jgi:aminopeptidase N